MGLIEPVLRTLNRSLERIFGGAEVHRQAFDMMRRLERSYGAAWVVISLSFVPGLVHYTAWPIIPLAAVHRLRTMFYAPLCVKRSSDARYFVD